MNLADRILEARHHVRVVLACRSPVRLIMIERGLIQITNKKKRRLFFIDDTRSLFQKLNERQERLKQIMPELQALHNLLPSKPKIVFYEGFEGMKDIYLDMVATCQPGDEIIEFIGLKNIYNMLTSEFIEFIIKERVKKKIKLRMIASNCPEAIKIWETGPKALRKVKIIENKELEFQAYMGVYKNKITLISYVENFMAVIIESRQLSNMYRAMFEITWGALPDYKS